MRRQPSRCWRSGMPSNFFATTDSITTTWLLGRHLVRCSQSRRGIEKVVPSRRDMRHTPVFKRQRSNEGGQGTVEIAPNKRNSSRHNYWKWIGWEIFVNSFGYFSRCKNYRHLPLAFSFPSVLVSTLSSVQSHQNMIRCYICCDSDCLSHHNRITTPHQIIVTSILIHLHSNN